MRARLGDHDTGSLREPYPHEVRSIRRKIEHEGFHVTRSDTMVNDIALLELSAPVAYKPNIVPVCLPAKDADYAGELASVTGWGSTSRWRSSTFELQKLDGVRVVETEPCSKWLHYKGIVADLRETHLCAGFKQYGGSPCSGDSGGPLIVEREGYAQVIGIVSFGFDCQWENSPVIYTKVSKYTDWIRSNVKRNSAR